MSESSPYGTDAVSTPEVPDESETNTSSTKSPKAMWLVTFVAAVTGFASPFLLRWFSQQTASGSILAGYEIPATGQTAVVNFGEVTVNLREGRMNRYLRIKISVLVAKAEEESVQEAIDASQALLRNWLLSHVADKGIEEISGKAGLNMLRREIKSQFNELLFADRRDRIFDILFEEFTIQ